MGFRKWQNVGCAKRSSIYSQVGSYKISLEVANALGCKDSDSKDIVVAPLPVITVGPDPVIPLGTG
jgi:hypothetical protein